MRRVFRNVWWVCLYEVRMMHADRTLWVVNGALLALVCYGLLNGLAQTRERERTVAAVHALERDTAEANARLLGEVLRGEVTPDPFANPIDPASMGSGLAARHAVMPTTALSPLAFGQSDLLPDYYNVTYRSKATFMYDGEIQNPWNLLSGRFDVAFVLIYLMPLLVFAVGYNMLSAEREQGTLRMLLSQPISTTTLMVGKLLPRAVSLWAIAVLVPVVVLVATRADTRAGTALSQLALWMAIVAAYAAFWFGLACVTNAISRSSAVNALTLIGSWVLLVLMVPVLLNVAVSYAAPTPSRTELATRTRMITVAALTRYNDLLSSDYKYVDDPSVLLAKDGKLNVAPRLRGLYLVQRDTDVELEGLLTAFDRQVDSQQRLVNRWAWLSPAIVMHEAMAAVAGNGTSRYVHFRNLVGTFHARWRAFFEPRVLEGIAMTETDLANLPTFEWRERSDAEATGEIVNRLVQVALPALLLLAWTLAHLRRFRPL